MPPPKIIISLLCMLLSGGLGLLVWNGLPRATRSLVIQCFTGTLITLAARHWQPNGWLHNLYLPVDFGLVIWASTAFLSPRTTRIYLPAATGIYLCTWLGFLISHQDQPFRQQPFAIWAFLTGSILITVVYLTALFQVTLSGSIIRKKSTLIVCFAILLYYACTTPLFGMLNYLILKDPRAAQDLHSHLNWGFSNARYLLTGIYFLSYAWKYPDNTSK